MTERPEPFGGQLIAQVAATVISLGRLNAGPPLGHEVPREKKEATEPQLRPAAQQQC